MDTIYAARRERLRRLIAEHGGPLPLAKALGLFGSSYLVQLAGPNPRREVSEKFARKIEAALRLPVGWMDGDETEPARTIGERAAAYNAGWDVAAAAGAVLVRLDARRLHLSPEAIGALIDLAHAHGQDPTYLDRLIRLVELVRLKPTA